MTEGPKPVTEAGPAAKWDRLHRWRAAFERGRRRQLGPRFRPSARPASRTTRDDNVQLSCRLRHWERGARRAPTSKFGRIGRVRRGSPKSAPAKSTGKPHEANGGGRLEADRVDGVDI
jgi:hypothetical protein